MGSLSDQVNGAKPKHLHIERAIPSVPITKQRKPFINTDSSRGLQHAGTARANLAATTTCPEGTTSHSYAAEHSQQTVLQQHISFFDPDSDGIIWPHDTFFGLHSLGFNILLCLLAVFIVHANFSYPTLPTWIPDPLFRIHVANIHMDKHGSDTNTYDHEGRFVPQHFEDIFEKYAGGQEWLTIEDVMTMVRGQRCYADPIGWAGAIFEWLATYILLWPEDGRMKKEDIRGVYDGSIFYTIAARRHKAKTR